MLIRAHLRNSRHLIGKVVIPISMGSPYQEGNFLRATISATKQRFSDYEVLLTDTLYRHTLALNGCHHSEVMAKDLGDQWIKNHESYIDGPIIRWDICRADAKFGQSLAELQTLYKSNLKYYETINHDCSTFIKRYGKHNILHPEPTSFCRTYILEETAGLLSFCRRYELYHICGQFTEIDYCDSGTLFGFSGTNNGNF